MRPTHHAALAAAALLAACSGPQVRTLGNGEGPPAYELRADDPADLQAQAQRLCAGGYVVLRQARVGQVPPSDDATGRWLLAAGDWLSGLPGNQAQATIVCRG